jgi:hypothetical protein
MYTRHHEEERRKANGTVSQKISVPFFFSLCACICSMHSSYLYRKARSAYRSFDFSHNIRSAYITYQKEAICAGGNTYVRYLFFGRRIQFISIHFGRSKGGDGIYKRSK